MATHTPYITIHDPVFHGRYSRGQEHLPHQPRPSSYADGMATHPGHDHHGRFCTGQETDPTLDQNAHEGSFADGMTH